MLFKEMIPVYSGNVTESIHTKYTVAMMVAAHTSETSVDIEFRTRQYIPEDFELHTRRRENLKSQINK
jgi:hypothetical protein